MPARSSRAIACAGSSYSTAKWQQSKQRRTCSSRFACARSTVVPVASASRGAPYGSSQRSKNAMASSVFSIAQSGSGSMSRWIEIPFSSRSRTSRSATRTTCAVAVRHPSSSPAAIQAL